MSPWAQQPVRLPERVGDGGSRTGWNAARSSRTAPCPGCCAACRGLPWRPPASGSAQSRRSSPPTRPPARQQSRRMRGSPCSERPRSCGHALTSADRCRSRWRLRTDPDVIRVWAVASLVSVVMSSAAFLSARTGLRNLREAASARRRPPLEPAEVAAGARPVSSAPTGWPRPADIGDAPLAAAYRDYARDRRETAVLLGELLILTAGAALGASIPDALRGGWESWPFLAALLFGALGVILRRRGEVWWVHVAAIYARRLGDLQTPPVPPPAVPPWWRRR